MVPKYMVIFVYILVDGSCNLFDKFTNILPYIQIFHHLNTNITRFFISKTQNNPLRKVKINIIKPHLTLFPTSFPS